MRTFVVALALVTAFGCSSEPSGAPDAAPSTGGEDAAHDAGNADAASNADTGAGAGSDAGARADGAVPDASLACPTACGDHATCQLGPGAPKCVCNAGYSGDGATCADVDECQTGAAACAAGDPCHNLPGSYFCACGPGQVWNGSACARAGDRRIGAGAEHLCRIDEAGEMRCWGKNRVGQLGDGTLTRRNVMTQVQGGHVWKGVSVFRDATCALDTGSRVWCWGYVSGLTSSGATQTAEPQQVGSSADWEQVSLGEYHACGLRQGGALWCWGYNTKGQLGQAAPAFVAADAAVQVEPGTAWAMVSAGVQYTCAVKVDGSLWCWGANDWGNLGDGTLASQSTPTRVGTDTDWRSVDAGAFFTTCGIRLDGSLWCWGQNFYGQVVGGSDQKVTTPLKRTDATGWRSVDSGSYSTCGVLMDGTVSCWGRAIGVGWSPAEIGSMGGALDVTTGEPGAISMYNPSFGCALWQDGSTWCWGQNNDGELAQGSFGNKDAPERVGQESWSQVEPGISYTCGLRQDGTFWCWGGGPVYEVLVRVTPQPMVQSPMQLVLGADWRAVATGASKFCGLKTDHSLWCAGGRFSYQVSQVGSDLNWAAIDLGRAFYLGSNPAIAAGIRDDKSLWTFGDSSPPSSAQFGTDTDWEETAISRTHTCGRRGGNVWCWYANKPGDPPVQVGTSSDWTQVRSAAELATLSGTISPTSYGIRTDGTMWSWTMVSTKPIALTQIGLGITWQSFDVGPGVICGIATDKSLWCWGETDLALAVSTGEIKRVPAPVRVGQDSDWAQVRVGYSHVTALKDDGSLWSWGYGASGELGHGDAWRLAPVQAR